MDDELASGVHRVSDPFRQVNHDEAGVKWDTDKTRFDLLPVKVEEAVAKVLTFGAKRYGDRNWQKVDDARNRYLAACVRHMNAYRLGEELDNETGLPHLAHAITNLTFILSLDLGVEGGLR